MARLVAMVIKSHDLALIQTSLPSQWVHSKYRLSYLLPAFLHVGTIAIVLEEQIINGLLADQIPKIQRWVSSPKSVRRYGDLRGFPLDTLILMTPEEWLHSSLHGVDQLRGIRTIVDQSDDLSQWLQSYLTVSLTAMDWEEIINVGETVDQILDDRTRLEKLLSNHPLNPYNCYSLTMDEQEIIQGICSRYQGYLPHNWQLFSDRLNKNNQLLFATIDPDTKDFTLNITPINLSAYWQEIWQNRKILLIGSAIDINSTTHTFQTQLNLPKLTTINFGYDRHQQTIKLYIPSWTPLPETPQFHPIFIRETHKLLNLLMETGSFTVILIHETPLKMQTAVSLAANFGSKIQLETIDVSPENILICDWNFWLENQEKLPTPTTMIISTLPIPSLEDPLVSAKVKDYKNRHQDWFKNYLFPESLQILHRSIFPLRELNGRIAIFDNRINHRTYGKQVLQALEPMNRVHQVDKWVMGKK